MSEEEEPREVARTAMAPWRCACGQGVASRPIPSFCSSSVVNTGLKLQALVYDILPSATAVFSYVIGSRKLSDNEQFFVGALTVVSLLQTTQIISDVCFMLPCGLRQLK